MAQPPPADIAWTRDELEALYRLSDEVSRVNDVRGLVDLMTRRATGLVGSRNVCIGILQPSDGSVHMYMGPELRRGGREIQVVNMSAPGPWTHVIASGEPQLIESFEEFASIFPTVAPYLNPGDARAIATFPIRLDGVTIGAMYFRFEVTVELSGRRLELLEELVRVSTNAMTTIRRQADLEAFAERLQRSNHDLEDFAAVVAHDLKAPVRRIGSFVQLLIRDIEPLPEKAAARAETITEQVRRLDALLHDVLEYSRVTDAAQTYQVVDTNALVDETVLGLAEQLGDVDGTIERADLPHLFVERSLVAQVFFNLFENAIKYRDPERAPAIYVQASEVGRVEKVPWWRFEVRDNGIGIDPTLLDDVFTMFMRLPTEIDTTGTGVGLAFARRVVEGHGGEIGVESEPGVGSSFWFTLPGISIADEF